MFKQYMRHALLACLSIAVSFSAFAADGSVVDNPVQTKGDAFVASDYGATGVDILAADIPSAVDQTSQKNAVGALMAQSADSIGVDAILMASGDRTGNGFTVSADADYGGFPGAVDALVSMSTQTPIQRPDYNKRQSALLI